jgi:protease-4
VRQSLETLIADSFDWFVDIVAERRGLSHDAALKLADGRIYTGRQGLADKLIDAIGGEPEAVAWLEDERDVTADLPIVTAYPHDDDRLGWFTRFLGSEARAALGFNPTGPVVLDGLVSLWQVGPAS